MDRNILWGIHIPTDTSYLRDQGFFLLNKHDGFWGSIDAICFHSPSGTVRERD